jgi:tetratricopeptide (TPR) repeat protein
MGKKRRKKLARAARPSGAGGPAKAPESAKGRALPGEAPPKEKLWRWAPLVLVILPLFIYANSLTNAFHYDDFHSLVDNPHIRKLENIPFFFTSARTTSVRADFGHYRPVLFSTYALSYALGGYDYDPGMFRVFNLVFHILNGLLLFAVFRSILRPDASVGTTEDGRVSGNTAAAFFGALLFAVHPLNTESINYISCRSNVLATTFYLAGVGLFVWYAGSASTRRRTVFYAGSLGCFGLGLLTKEIVITLPAILMLLDILILNPDAKTFDFKTLFSRHAAFWMVAGLHISLIFTVGFKPMYERRDAITNLIIQTKAMVFYLWLLVFPRGLSISHGFDTTGKPSAAYWGSLLIIGGILFLAWKLRMRYGLLSFTILWYFITLIPTSSVITLKIPVNEHRVYLPGIGFAVAVGFLVDYAGRRARMGRRLAPPLSKLFVPAFLAVTVVSSISVMVRNQTWKTPKGVWEDAVKKCPSNAHAHANLGFAYGNLGRYTEAVEAYKQAIRLRPDDASAHFNLGDYASAHFNLGHAYVKLGRYDEAIEACKQAIRLKPDLVSAHLTLGNAYDKLGRYDETIEACEQAIRLKPDLAEAHYILGNTYVKLGRNAEAIEAFKQAIRLKPGLANAHYNLGNTYAKLGRNAEAIEAFKQAIRLKPDWAEAHYILGNAYSNLGRWAEAVEAYKQVIRLKPDYPDYADAHNNLGNAYNYLGRYNEAVEACEQAIRLNPDLAEPHYNIGNAYGSLSRYDEAVEAYKQAIRLKPDYAEAHFMLGVSYFTLGRRGDALDKYKVLKELDTESANTLFDLIYE